MPAEASGSRAMCGERRARTESGPGRGGAPTRRKEAGSAHRGSDALGGIDVAPVDLDMADVVQLHADPSTVAEAPAQLQALGVEVHGPQGREIRSAKPLRRRSSSPRPYRPRLRRKEHSSWRQIDLSASCQHVSSKGGTHSRLASDEIGFRLAFVEVSPTESAPGAYSTSWGSLVRAQYRPPHESPAQAGFLFPCSQP